ncbi:MAG: DUF2147 domain-containing protein [Sphingobacteriaceae bacterium]|nr:DUF2147 domain-containing protein [Sphingobacteriaceae bacterium]
MKKLGLIIAFLAVSVVTFAQKNDVVLGQWLNKTGEAKIEIYKKGQAYFGKIIWLKIPKDANGNAKLDHKNPNESLRSKPILGLEMLKNFVFEDNEWTDGTIYDPKSGKTYSCNITLKSNNELNIRGYIGISLLGRTETWSRAK